MNAVAKSANLASFFKATTSAVPNGFRPAAASGKVTKPKIVVLSTVTPIISHNMQESLLAGALRIKSGVAASTQVTAKRCAHSDVQWPDFDHYRKDSMKDPTVNSREGSEGRKTYSYLVSAGAGIGAAYGAKSFVIDLVGSMSASADVMALSKLEVKLNNIPEGKSAVFKWRGKPVFVRHRIASEIQKEESVDLATLRDPQDDSARVKQKKWLIVLGVCTHLGCVPIANAGEYGGYYCPCHGSHYDASGRIRKGPAPLNLEVPPYEFTEEGTVIVG